VVAESSVDRETIVAACERALARYKTPRIVEFRSELPRTARGKIDRRALRSSSR
jgi:long-chain acyl-CoA synthetase